MTGSRKGPQGSCCAQYWGVPTGPIVSHIWARVPSGRKEHNLLAFSQSSAGVYPDKAVCLYLQAGERARVHNRF
jgi:hypothetical protein